MRRLLIILLGLVAVISCKKSSENIKVPVLDNATYKGTFQRKLTGTDDIANVELNFASGKFSGNSNKVQYPALCNGIFTIKGDSIKFENACYWTANFDWSIILSGSYAIKQNGNDLQISRKYMNGKYEDLYLLTKQ